MADYIEGRRAVEEALKAGVPIRKVFVQTNQQTPPVPVIFLEATPLPLTCACNYSEPLPYIRKSSPSTVEQYICTCIRCESNISDFLPE